MQPHRRPKSICDRLGLRAGADIEVIETVDGDVLEPVVDQPETPAAYWPQRNSNSMVFLLRSARAGSESFTDEIRTGDRGADDGGDLQTLDVAHCLYADAAGGQRGYTP